MNTRLILRNLPLDVKEKDVKRLVGRFGKIKSAYIARDPKAPNLAFAEVVMAKESEAKKAARTIDHEWWHGKILETQLAEEEWE